MKKLILVISLIGQFAFAAGLNQGLDKNSVLIQAHESFLQGDYHLTLMNIKIGLEQFDRDLIMKKNLLALYGNLLHTGKLKDIDLGWYLPKEMTRLSLNIEREMDNKEIKYSMILGGNTLEPNMIKTFKVVRFPETVVMDKDKNIGRLRERPDDDGKPAFYFRTVKSAQPVSAGLYNIEISLTNGASLKAWIIIDELMNSSANPEFINVSEKPIFKTTQPKFAWKDFKTAEFDSSENRGVYFEISRNLSPTGWETLWNVWEKQPKTTKVQVGVTPHHTVNKLPLENGDYMAMIQYSEHTRLGDMRMTRKSSQILDFTIQLKK